jgi:hypothetical protein
MAGVRRTSLGQPLSEEIVVVALKMIVLSLHRWSNLARRSVDTMTSWRRSLSSFRRLLLSVPLATLIRFKKNACTDSVSDSPRSLPFPCYGNFNWNRDYEHEDGFDSDCGSYGVRRLPA